MIFKLRRYHWCPAIIALLLSAAQAQVPDTIRALRFQWRDQIGSNRFSVEQGNVYIGVTFPSPVKYPGVVQLVWPDYSYAVMPRVDDQTFEGVLNYESWFPSGPGQYYFVRVNSVPSGTFLFSPGDAAALRVTNLPELQPFWESPLTIQWARIKNRGPYDYISLKVDSDDAVIFEVNSDRGDLPLDATSFSWTKPVPINVPLHGELHYLREQHASLNDGATSVFTGVAASVYFELRYVPGLPKITQAPTRTFAAWGDTVTFSVIASGAPIYQWFHDGQAIPGATAASYVLTAQTEQAGNYSVSVTNAYGTVTTEPVQLGVAPALDVKTAFVMGAGTEAVDGPRGVGRFGTVNGLTVDENGYIYVADTTAVRVLAPDGTLTTLAGSLTESGEADGFGASARFGSLHAIARSSSGELFVCDAYRDVIRRITPDGTVSVVQRLVSAGVYEPANFSGIRDVTVGEDGEIYVLTSTALSVIPPDGVVRVIAGQPGVYTEKDGVGAGAGFRFPSAFALVPNEGLVVVENGRLRWVSLAGVVTTFFSPRGSDTAALEGPASGVRPVVIKDVAVDADGVAYVVDQTSIRRVTRAGWATVLAGDSGLGARNGIGRGAQIYDPGALTIAPDGTFYFVNSNSPALARSVRTATLKAGGPLPSASVAPKSRVAAMDSTTTLDAPFTDVPVAYQWFRDDVLLPGATNRTLMLNALQAADSGNYAVRVTTAAATARLAAGTLNVDAMLAPSRIVNLSTRTFAGTGTDVLIAGFVVGGGDGSARLPVLLRGDGPALAQFGLTGYLNDPLLTLFGKDGRPLAGNDNWGGEANIGTTGARVGAFTIVANDSRDAALVQVVDSLPHTVQVRGADGGTGLALAEVYDAAEGIPTAATPRLVNLSARARVLTGSGVLIAGFVVSGNAPKTVLIRGVGPMLDDYGVKDALKAPQLALYRESTLIATNAGWGGDEQLEAVMQRVGAFKLVSYVWGVREDAALLVTVDPGVYSAQVRSVDGTTGVALVEIYEVP